MDATRPEGIQFEDATLSGSVMANVAFTGDEHHLLDALPRSGQLRPQNDLSPSWLVSRD